MVKSKSKFWSLTALLLWLLLISPLIGCGGGGGGGSTVSIVNGGTPSMPGNQNPQIRSDMLITGEAPVDMTVGLFSGPFEKLSANVKTGQFNIEAAAVGWAQLFMTTGKGTPAEAIYSFKNVDGTNAFAFGNSQSNLGKINLDASTGIVTPSRDFTQYLVGNGPGNSTKKEETPAILFGNRDFTMWVLTSTCSDHPVGEVRAAAGPIPSAGGQHRSISFPVTGEQFNGAANGSLFLVSEYVGRGTLRILANVGTDGAVNGTIEGAFNDCQFSGGFNGGSPK